MELVVCLATWVVVPVHCPAVATVHERDDAEHRNGHQYRRNDGLACLHTCTALNNKYGALSTKYGAERAMLRLNLA